MVMGGGGNGLMFSNCGSMGMGCGFDDPMIVVEVRHGSWVIDLLGLRVCDGFWFTDLLVAMMEVFYLFIVLLWFVVVVLVRREL